MTLKFLPFLHLLMLCSAVFLAGCGEKPDTADAPVNPAAQASAAPGQNLQPGEMSPEQRQQVLDKILQAKSREQAEGLGSGKVVVNGAWNYKGYSYLSPDPNAGIEARMVAVDVTISGHTQNFDIDDIEIVDGRTMISYGSDPHAEYLTLDGKLMPAEQLPNPPPLASRWLLIYAFPKATPNFHLYYWGIQLTPEPVEIGESGLELPFPPKE